MKANRIGLRQQVALLLLAIALPSWIAGQVITGSVLGVVTDSSGAVMPNVRIKVANVETNVSTVAVTDSAGEYLATYLPPGTYEVSAEARGFRTSLANNVLVRVDSKTRVDIRMVPGQVTEKVTVTTDNIALQTDSSDLNTDITQREVAQLPNIGRNVMRDVVLVPGAVTRGNFSNPALTINIGDDTRQNASSFFINGGRAGVNEILLDGAPNTCCAFNEVAIEPNLDAVGEVKIETNNYSAEFGRTTGGVINVTTKSGTNVLHGSLYENFRNPALNANSFYNNMFGQDSSGNPKRRKGAFNLNQYGGSVGGPVVLPHYNGRDKTFFFASYEGLQFARPAGSGSTFTVPTAAQRTGDFSQTVVVSGSQVLPLQIYQPYPGTSTVANGVITRDAFPGNKIPTSLLDPRSLKILSLWPQANIISPNLDGSDNYYDSGSDHTITNQLIVKIDHSFGDKQRSFFRYTHDWTRNTPYNHWHSTDPTLSGDQPTTQDNPSATLGHVWTQSPTSIFEFRANLIRVNLWDAPPGGFTTNLQSLGFAPSMNAANVRNVFPQFSFANVPGDFLNPGLGAYILRDNHSTNWALTGQWTKIRGNFTHKVGGDFRVYQNNFNQPNLPGFSFNSGGNGVSFTRACDAISGTCPQNLLGPNQLGYGLADFLIGAAMGNASQFGIPGVYTTGDPTHSLTYKYAAVFSQNDWKVTRKLTLNLGLRYEVQMPVTERYNRLTQWNSAGMNATGTPGLYEFSGVNGLGRGRTDPDWNDFGPRVGLAWRPIEKTVIRTGYGITFDSISGTGSGGPLGIGADGFNAPAFQDVRPTTGPQAGEDILVRSFYDSFTGGGQTYAPNANDPRLLGRSVVAVRRNQRTPYTQQWNFTIERELPGQLNLIVSYVGSKTTHAFVQQTSLSGSGTPYNIGTTALLAADQTFAQTGVNPLNALVTNPFYGISQSGDPNTTGPKIQQHRLMEPFPAYDGVILWHDRYASAYYDALQIQVRHAFKSGMEIGGHYTFSKDIDYGESNTGNKYGENGGTGLQSFGVSANNMGLEKAPAPGDVPHRAVVYYIFTSPFGKGHKYLTNTPVASQVLEGWRVSGITTFQDGFPLGISGSSLGRPDVIGDPVLPGQYQCIGDGRTACPLPDGTSVIVPFGRRLYFNPHAFATRTVAIQGGPNAGSIQAVPYYWGTAPRLASWLRGYGLQDWDMSLAREFRIREHLRLEFRVDASNVFNHFNPNDGNTLKGISGININRAVGPIGASTNASFGTTNLDPGATGPAALPRNLQLAMRLVF